jgi:hypothetical protein
VVLPVPGTNVLPAFSLVLLSLGLMRRDGALYLLGLGLGIAGVLLAAAAAGLAVELLRWAGGRSRHDARPPPRRPLAAEAA